MIDTILAWLATYLIHSSALILAVWGFTRWTALDSLTRSLLWKIALVGGLFTATLQTGFGVRSALGHYDVAAPTPPPLESIEVTGSIEVEETITFDHEVVVVEVVDGVQSVTVVSMHGDTGPAWEPMPALAPGMPPPAEEGAAPPKDGGLAAALVGLFLGGAMLGLGRLTFTARRLRRLLHGRVDLVRGPLAERLALLIARARLSRRGVRLTMSPALVSPIALARREIVVPEAAIDLEARQQEAMLAHELAHVVRQDPAWLVLAAVIEAVLFIQPLNRLARAGMQTAAEELADDWAVRHLGTGLHLARCLTEVASWQGRGGVGPFVSGMASGDGSALVQRVQRLVGDRGRERRWSPTGRVLAATGLLAAVAWGAPGISVAVAQAQSVSTETVEETEETEEIEGAIEASDLDLEFEPTLAFNAVAGDSVVMQTNAEPTRKQRRQLRRAARLERKADKARDKAERLRGRGGEPRDMHVVVDHDDVRIEGGGKVVIIRDDDDDRRGDAEAMRVHAMHVPRFDRAEIERIRDQARETARAHQAEADRVRQRARALAREALRQQPEIEALRREAEALGRRAHGELSPERIAEIQREAEALGRRASRFSAEDVARIQAEADRMAAEAPRFSQEQIDRITAEARRAADEASRVSVPDVRRVEQMAGSDARELERAVRRAIDKAPLDAATKRKVEAELEREFGKIDAKAEKARAQADKRRERADKAREKQREQAEKAREKAEKARAEQPRE